MQTKVVKIDSANIDDAAMKEACDLIRAGELVAFPTAAREVRLSIHSSTLQILLSISSLRITTE